MKRICSCCSYDIFNILLCQISFHEYCIGFEYLLVGLAAFVLAAFVVAVVAAVGVVWLVML